MPTTIASTPAPLPIPVAMSGAIGGHALGLLPIGAGFVGPAINSANEPTTAQITVQVK